MRGEGHLSESSVTTLYIPIGSRYLLRMVLEVKVLPENGRTGGQRTSSGWSWTLRDNTYTSTPEGMLFGFCFLAPCKERFLETPLSLKDHDVPLQILSV